MASARPGPDEWRVDDAYGGQLAIRPDGVLKDLAAAQLGVVARRQLVQAGVSERALDRLLARGRLVPLHRSVYAVGHRQLRPEGYRLAAVLACGDGAVLSHRRAAAAWGLLGDSRYRHDVTVPAEKASGRALPGLVVHRAQLAGGDRAERDGVPVTSVARTLVDRPGRGRGGSSPEPSTPPSWNGSTTNTP